MYIDRKHIHNKRKTVADQAERFLGLYIVVYFFLCNQTEIVHKDVQSSLSYSFLPYIIPILSPIFLSCFALYALYANVKHRRIMREHGKRKGGGERMEKYEKKNLEVFDCIRHKRN